MESLQSQASVGTSGSRGSGPGSEPLAPVAKGCPFLGNTFQFLEDTTGLLRQSHDTLGPVFRLKALWLKYSVISGFAARDFLKQHKDDAYLSRTSVFAAVGRQLGETPLILGMSGEGHEYLRQVLHVVYSREVASPWVPRLVEVVRAHVREWRAGSVHGVMDLVERLGFEMYSQIACGQSLGDTYDDILRVMRWNMNTGGRVWPFWAYRIPRYQRSRQRLLDRMGAVVKERRRTGIPTGEPATILDTLFAAKDGAGKGFSDDAAICYATYGFAGSCCYMSRLLGFLMYEILTRPELMRELVEEVDQHFADGIRDAADLRDMRLLRATYLENLRFHPVSQGMPFLAEKDFAWSGKRIEKGDLVVLSQVPMLFSETPFREPDRFDPTRCLPPRNEHARGDAFHPFGIAHRTCAAMGLVETMSLTAVATLLHELRMEVAPKGYRLKIRVEPLPGPDAKFGVRVAARRGTGDRVVMARPPGEDRVLAQFPGAEDPEVQRLLGCATRVVLGPREVIVREGDAADALFIVLRGEAHVSRETGKAEDSQFLARLGEGQFFGEIGLLQNAPRNATVRSGPHGATLLRVDRKTVDALLAANDFVMEEIVRLLRKRLAADHLLEALPGLKAGGAARWLPEFESRTVPAGTVFVREGEPASEFFVITAGEVAVEQGTNGTVRELARLCAGEYFGEIGLLRGTSRTATVRAVSPEVTVLVLDAAGFRRLVGEQGGSRGDLALALYRRIS